MKKPTGSVSIRDLNRDLKEKTIRQVYLLLGNEVYLRTQCRDNIIKTLIPEGDTMNLAFYEGGDIDENAVMRAADTLPFFNDYRLIVISDSSFFSSSHDAMARYIEQIPQSTCMVFSEEKADSRLKLYKAIIKYGAVIDLSTPPDATLLIWLDRMLRQAGRSADRPTLEYFLQVVIHDMTAMKNEMEKLISYTQGRSLVTRQDIDRICSSVPENKIFDMIDAVSGGDKKKAFRLYDDLLVLQEPPMRILFNLNARFRQMNEVKRLRVKGYPVRTIASMTDMREFIVKKSAALGERFSVQDLRSLMEFGAEMEEAVKTGKLSDKLAVELMLIRCSQI